MKKKSFNLVEIATVVSIILIITSSVAASFFIAGSKRLEAEARKIIYDAATGFLPLTSPGEEKKQCFYLLLFSNRYSPERI